MKELTRKILDEEAKKYFPEVATKYDASDLFDTVEPIISDVNIRVLPEYPNWRKDKKISLFRGSKSMGWVMQDYICSMLGLARYLIENKYPREAILTMLPHGLSLKVDKRLNE